MERQTISPECGCRRWRCPRRLAARSTWPRSRRTPGRSCCTSTRAPARPASRRQTVGMRSREQAAFVKREHLPFALLSDPALRLAHELRLPTFEAAGMRLYRRITLVIEDGAIAKVFYPVFPPDRNAADVLTWLRERR